jgi:hypothetical protein
MIFSHCENEPNPGFGPLSGYHLEIIVEEVDLLLVVELL